MRTISKFSKVAQRALWGALSTFVLLLAGMGEARASHYAAADIDVRFIGPRPQQGFCGAFETQFRYVVTIRIYKACEGSVPLDDRAPYTVRSPSGCNGGAIISGTADTLLEGGSDTLDQLCGAFRTQNACFLGGQPAGYPYPGFIRRTYYDTISLPSACPDWTFAWSSSARNAGISNLQNPQGSLYVSCMVNNVAAPTNSTPRFTQDPIPFICVGKKSFFLNGPIDVDGDSLDVIPKAAESGYQVYYNYVAGFSPANPVGSPASDPYTVSGRTGTTTFLGPGTGKYVLAFRANEYNADGVLIGYSDRDVQVSVLPCTIAAPTIDPSPVDVAGGIVVNSDSNNNAVTICPGSELKMSFNGSSQTPNAVLIMSSNAELATPGATFTVTGQATSIVRGDFVWTPTKADVGPHTFIVNLKDSSCINGQSILQEKNTVVSILVPGDIDAGPDGFYCPNPNSPPYQIRSKSPTQTTYSWSVLPGGSGTNTLSCLNCLNPEARPGFPTSYVITAAATPYICKLRDTVFVNTNGVKITQGPEVVLCRPTTFGMDAVANGLPPRQVITCGGSDFATCVLGGGGSTSTSDSVTTGNCTNTSSDATFNPFYTFAATQKSQILYRRDELRAKGVEPQTLRRIAFFVDALNGTVPINNLNIGLKCTQRQQMTVVGNTNFENNVTNVFTGAGPVNLIQGWNYFDLDRPFNYDTTQNLLVEICFSNAAPANQTSAAIQYSPTAYNSMLQRNFTSGNVCNNAATGSPFTSTPNRPNVRFIGCLPGDLPYIYKWTPGDFLLDSFGASVSAYVPKSIKYYVDAEGIEGCVVRDSINIIVPTDTITVNPMDSLICPGELAIIEATKDPYLRYQWYEGNFEPATTLDCDTCQRVLARPKVDTRYTVVGSIDYGNLIRKACPDTAFADVRLRMPAVIRVMPKDTIIKSGQRVLLTATGGERYTWTPVSAGLNTNTGPRVVAQPQESTMFIVEGLDTNGCRGNDTANVNINYRQALFVPNAFTPNGDGRNDVFSVVNLSVQKVIEFRVFNRWGQEIFSTTDPRQGWDGTWKSTPQPTGSYNYIIRIAYPDGITDTFKGEVTLIR